MHLKIAEVLHTFNYLKNSTTTKRQAFAGCSSLEDITLPDTLRQVEYDDLDGAFTGCSSLRYINTGNGIHDLEGVFSTEALEELLIGDAIEIIPGYAFAGCNKFENVIIGNKMLKQLKKSALRLYDIRENIS